MSGPAFEIPQEWSEYQEQLVADEQELCDTASERAAEINSPGCDTDKLQQWYEQQPIETKLRIQYANLSCCEAGSVDAKYFCEKIRELELQRRQRGIESGGGVVGNDCR
jgi:hypothetical protein